MVSFTSDGRACFRFLAPRAARVQLVGEFTDWLGQPIEMSPTVRGWWQVSRRLADGEYRFRYLVDGQWVTDFAAFGVSPNDYGQFDSVLVVGPITRRQLIPAAAS